MLAMLLAWEKLDFLFPLEAWFPRGAEALVCLHKVEASQDQESHIVEQEHVEALMASDIESHLEEKECLPFAGRASKEPLKYCWLIGTLGGN